MADWLRDNPIGAYLLNVLTTILIVSSIAAIGVKRYGEKIDETNDNTKTIMNTVVNLPDSTKIHNNGR